MEDTREIFDEALEALREDLEETIVDAHEVLEKALDLLRDELGFLGHSTIDSIIEAVRERTHLEFPEMND